MRRSAPGYTLVELLLVMALAATLLSLAGPGFGALRDEWALRAATHALLGGLAETRLAALQLQDEAHLCPSTDGITCSSRASGYRVHALGAGVGRALHVSPLPPGVELSGNRPAATYYAWPRAALPVTLTLCAVHEHARSRRIVVSQTGRPRVERAGRC